MRGKNVVKISEKTGCYPDAVDEVVANACEKMLENSKALERLATENAGLFVKVGEKLKNLIRRIRNALRGMYSDVDSLHGETDELMKALGDKLDEFQQLYDRVLYDSITNMRKALAEAESAQTRESLEVLEGAAEKEGINVSEDSVKLSEEYDRFGNKYWRIETSKDIFAGLKSNEQIEKAAYDYLLDNRDYNVVLDTFDGKKVKFIQIKRFYCSRIQVICYAEEMK